MRVIVRFHDDCKADVRSWLARLPGSIEDRRALVDVALDELKQELARTTGHPTSTEFRDEPLPASYWWKYTEACWVR